MSDSNQNPSTNSPVKFKLVEKILAFLNLGDNAKLINFFAKQVKVLEKDIIALKKNNSALESNHKDEIEEIDEKIQDKQDELNDAFMNVKVEDIDTNEKANRFADVYWDRIDTIQDEIKALEDKKAYKAEILKKQIEENNKEIAVRQKRIDMIK